MRLIDADKLIDNLDDMIPADDSSDYVMGIATAIQEAGRMACEDYIEAIPIEWIKQWASINYIEGEYSVAVDMIDDWREEQKEKTLPNCVYIAELMQRQAEELKEQWERK